MDGHFSPTWNTHLDASLGQLWCLKITCENSLSINSAHLCIHAGLKLWKTTNSFPQNTKTAVKAGLWWTITAVGRSCSSWCHSQQLAQQLQFIHSINLCSKQKLEFIILQPVTSMHSTLVPSWIKSFQKKKKRTTQKGFFMMTKDDCEGSLLTSLNTLQPRKVNVPVLQNQQIQLSQPSAWGTGTPTPQHPSLPGSWLGSGTSMQSCNFWMW